MSQHSITKTWIVLIIILVAIFSSGWFIFDKYFQYELEKTSEESKKELAFLSDLIKQRLQKHDYQLVEDFIIDWGKRDSSIVEIILTSANGFELASYSSSLTPTHELIEEAQLTYSYDGLADLYLRKSLDDAYAIHRSFLYELLAGYIFIAFIFYYLTYTLVHTKKQKQELIFENTQRVQAEEKIRTLYQAIEQSPVSVMITDIDANIEYVNSTFERNTGYSADEVIGKNPRILKSGETPAQVHQELWQTIANGNAWQGELINRKKNGEIFWESAHIAPVLDESGNIQHYLAVREDITLRKQQEEKILHQAHFDSLTDLPNRFLSLDRLSQLISEAERSSELVAILFLDLDDFKKINDTLGHDIGDKLLVQAASRLQDEVRNGDTVGRLGGDEFIILLGGLDSASDARPVVENLLNRFRDAFRIDGRELMITASVGIAMYPNDGDSPSTLLRNADSAMYHSKEEGRNTYSYFTDVMNQDVSRRLALEEQMHGALDRDEFKLYYQPKADIADRNIIGFEALLRWQNPALGTVSPDEFIPIAEQTGLIIPIGEFVLSQALETTADWQKKFNQPFTMAVNLSPRQFRDPNLVNFIEQTIASSGISSESLELEITEGVLMSGHTYIDKALSTINDLGVCIAMDDFGTGYSSLSYLRRYPFDVLKIDRSFICDILTDIADRELVNAAIAMAHSLGLKVVAEGVETEGQLALLAEQGCEIAQGYLFGKPATVDETASMLTSLFNRQ